MTNAIDVIRQVAMLGGQLSLKDDGVGLHVSVPAPLPEEVRQALREHKAAIMVALGAPLDTVVASVLEEIRPQLPPALQRLPDDKLLALVNWSIIVAWQRSMRSVGVDDTLSGR